MSQLPLTKIGFYNPRRLTDLEIEASFIARIALFKFIFEKISNHSQAVIPQHIIIIGQRGMGKTLLLYRLGVELRKSPNNKKFIPLNYPEEQYNIDRLSKFWLNSLKALIDALDTENQTDLADQLENELDELNTETRNDASDMYQIFQSWINKIDRCPVLLVDNLNLIFNNISTDEQHKLRANLMTKGSPILIGASAVTIKDTIEYGAPFYDAFLIQKLYKIKLEESIDILKNLSRLTQIPEHQIAERFMKNKGRIETIHQLTGGTPRTLAMLFPLIREGFSEDIQNDLHALMDMITPLYKARFEELSTQMQIVLDAIALNWHPASLEQLRKITQLTNAQLSPQLKRLVDVGWLNKLKSNKSKGDLYEISERFFNVWYLMRRSNRRQQRDLNCLSRFLEMYYGDYIMQIAALRLEKPTETEEDAFIDLAIANIIKDKKLSKALSDKSHEKLIEEAKNDPNILLKYSIPDKKIIEKAGNLLTQFFDHLKKNKLENAMEKGDQFLSFSLPSMKNLSLAFLIKSYISYSQKIQKKEVQIIVLKKASEIADQLIENKEIWLDKIWLEYGNVYFVSKDFKKSIDFYKKIESMELKDTFYWLCFGVAYTEKKEYKEAEKAYLKSIELNENQVYAILYLGNIYNWHFKKYDAAAQRYEQVVKFEIDKKELTSTWLKLGKIYFEKLFDLTKARMAYEKVVELDSKNIEALLNLGQLYLSEGKMAQSKIVSEKILRIDPKNSKALFNLGVVCQIGLHQPQKSIDAYLKCINLIEDSEPQFADKLRYDLFLLYGTLNDFDKAESQFRLIKKSNNIQLFHFLCSAVLSFEAKNAGIAKGFIEKAVLETWVGHNIFYWPIAGIIIKNLNYGDQYLEILKEVGILKEWKPYYVAMKALLSKEPELYLNTVAEEVRKPAAEILDWMVKFEQAKR